MGWKINNKRLLQQNKYSWNYKHNSWVRNKKASLLPGHGKREAKGLHRWRYFDCSSKKGRGRGSTRGHGCQIKKEFVLRI